MCILEYINKIQSTKNDTDSDIKHQMTYYKKSKTTLNHCEEVTKVPKW